jgi:hypothetical protein
MYFTVTGEISDSQPQPVQLETKKMGWRRRKIRHIAAMQNVVLKFVLQRDFAAGVYLSEAQNPIPGPLHKHCIRVYSMIIHMGGGGELNQREGERGNRGENISQSWVENINMTEYTQEIG